jgi:hypothetical protein
MRAFGICSSGIHIYFLLSSFFTLFFHAIFYCLLSSLAFDIHLTVLLSSPFSASAHRHFYHIALITPFPLVNVLVCAFEFFFNI